MLLIECVEYRDCHGVLEGKGVRIDGDFYEAPLLYKYKSGTLSIKDPFSGTVTEFSGASEDDLKMLENCLCCNVASNKAVKTYLYSTTIPSKIAANYTYVDLSLSVDTDITGIIPAGLEVGDHIVFRKIGTAFCKLIYQDDNGVNYEFVDKHSEYMTLFWSGSNWKLH